MWIPLDAVDPDRTGRYGVKACTLARLRGRGLPVPPSWVLPVEAVAGLDAAAAADDLRQRDASVRRWMLRSSSPLEDRPGASAAGLFESRPADADQLADGLEAVAAGARAPQVRALVGEVAPLAVLAQPLLDLELWCTAEIRPGSRATTGPPPHVNQCPARPLHPSRSLFETGAARQRATVQSGLTSEQAKAIARNPMNKYLKSLVDAASDWTSGAKSDDYPGYDKIIEGLSKETFDSQVEKGGAWVGTPDSIREDERVIATYLGE